MSYALSYKREGKLFSVLKVPRHEQHAVKTYWSSGGIAPCILNLRTRWRWVVSFTSWPLYPRDKSSRWGNCYRSYVL